MLASISDPAPASFGVLDQSGYCVDGRLGTAQNRDSQRLERRDALFRRSHPRYDDWLGCRGLDFSEDANERVHVAMHQLQPDNTNMQLRIRKENPYALSQKLGLGDELSRNVHGIARATELRNDRLQCSPRTIPRYGHPQSQ